MSSACGWSSTRPDSTTPNRPFGCLRIRRLGVRVPPSARSRSAENGSAGEQGVGNTSGDVFRDRAYQARKDLMRASHIFPNLQVPDIEAAKGFYVDFSG